MQAATTANEISYRSYCALGGCLNSTLQVVRSRHRTTYHYTGYGVASWRNDKPKGPSKGQSK